MTTSSLQFTERMSGHWSPLPASGAQRLPLAREDFLRGEDGDDREPLAFELTIHIDDLDHFLEHREHAARATGFIECDSLGGRHDVSEGTFNLFTSPGASDDIDAAKEMHYCLFFRDANGRALTLYGYKKVLKEHPLGLWPETTTLYTAIWEGHHDYEDRGLRDVVGQGVLHIAVADFMRQLTTFKTEGAPEAEVMARFFGYFAESLWEAYAPFVFGTHRARWNEHRYPIHTDMGVAAGEKQLIPFDTDDGLTLQLCRFKTQATKNVVLLLHGLTTSTDMYIMPEHQNLVNYLHENGFGDVWSLDWRGSGRLTYNLQPYRYTIDDVALYDIPKALAVIREQVGSDVKINVICHCVGSIAFMASMAAGLTGPINSVISNSVSYTPQVTWQARLKLMAGPFVLGTVCRYPYVSPKMPYYPGWGFGKWIYWMERSMRHECKEPACHMISFMWGWGFPAAFRHENLHPDTHRRLMDLFGGTPVHYYRHIRKMVFAGQSVPMSREGEYEVLPEGYLEAAAKRALPPLLLMSGSENHIFPGSNERTAQRLQELNPALEVRYLEVPGYGHQDVFMGKSVHVDVFPKLLAFLKQHAPAVAADQSSRSSQSSSQSSESSASLLA